MEEITNRIHRYFYRKFPSVARNSYLKKCSKLIGNNNKYFLLSFDCDNEEDITSLDKVAPFLTEHNIKATFAVPGEILQSGIDTFLKLSKEGHEFIGHGYKKHSAIKDGKYISTLYYHKLGDDELKEDIRKGINIISDLMGIKPKGFRIPHFGHSNSKKELCRVYKILKELKVEYSSSTLPFFSLKQGPIFKSYYGIYEIPISPSFTVPLSILDTYSYGFSQKSKKCFSEYYDEFSILMNDYSNRNIIVNTYCDPSQAVIMDDWWFKTIELAKNSGFEFVTLGSFYEEFR